MTEVHTQETKELLKQIISKIERLEQEKNTIADDIKDVFTEAKSHGFDTKIMKQILKIRKMDVEKVQEQEELLDMYKHALGMI